MAYSMYSKVRNKECVFTCLYTNQMNKDCWLLIWSTNFWLWMLFLTVLLSLSLSQRSIPSLKISYYKFDHCKQNRFVGGYYFLEISFPMIVHHFKFLPLLPGSLMQSSKWFPCSQLHLIKSILHIVIRVIFVDCKSDYEILLAQCSLKVFH